MMQSNCQSSPVDALKEAVRIAGSQEILAEKISDENGTVVQSTISRWITESGQVAAEFALKVEAVTGVSRSKLRPDLYPKD